jgi:hypothetical protein
VMETSLIGTSASRFSLSEKKVTGKQYTNSPL